MLFRDLSTFFYILPSLLFSCFFSLSLNFFFFILQWDQNHRYFTSFKNVFVQLPTLGMSGGARRTFAHRTFWNRTSSWQTQLSRHFFDVRFVWCAGSAVARGRRRQKLKRKKRNKKCGEISMAHFFAPFSTTIQSEWNTEWEHIWAATLAWQRLGSFHFGKY